MDVSKLIVLVEKYPELYNMRHPEYFNNIRRENIWEEIGADMKQSSAECKDRWAKVRDNHRKALQRRRTKSGQAAKNGKPPKYDQELSFLVPYIIDEDNRQSNFTATAQNEDEATETFEEDEMQNNDDNENVENPDIIESPSGSQKSNFPSDDLRRSSSATSSRVSSVYRHPAKRNRLGNCSEKTAAKVLQEFLDYKKQNSQPSHEQGDPLESFFTTMFKTVKGFPLRDQLEIKKKIFQLVSDKEIDLSFGVCEQPLTADLITTAEPSLQTTNQFSTGEIQDDSSTLKNYYTWGWQNSHK